MSLKKIVLAGGTGNIGQLLTDYFLPFGYQVVILSRSERKSTHERVQYVQWDGEHIGDWMHVLDGADMLINLSGKSIQCRFTARNKEVLLASRILPTKVLGQAIAQLQNPPRLWINFSGVSIFEGVEGFHDEGSTKYGHTFLADLVQQWENTFFEYHTPSTLKVCLRLSPVLSRDFGMFKELYPLAKLGLGGQVGDGEQQVCWIHEQDLVEMVKWIMDHPEPSPLYHACAPEPVKNKIFMKDLRNSVGMPLGIPLPTPFAKIGAYFKGVESDMLLLTNAVQSSRPLQQGFHYKFPNPSIAFSQLTKK